jgi:hypothetical protein
VVVAAKAIKLVVTATAVMLTQPRSPYRTTERWIEGALNPVN